MGRRRQGVKQKRNGKNTRRGKTCSMIGLCLSHAGSAFIVGIMLVNIFPGSALRLAG